MYLQNRLSPIPIRILHMNSEYGQRFFLGNICLHARQLRHGYADAPEELRRHCGVHVDARLR
eukprot:m.1330054 g.1330054  ORF g.1330054 m.1330054 type:complete len:62 (-) comp24861_c0_seq55:4695-4880(-)